MTEIRDLTNFIPELKSGPYGEWIVDEKNDGSHEYPTQMPWVRHTDTVYLFLQKLSKFVIEHKEINLIASYRLILEENGIEWERKTISEVDVSELDSTCVLALIFGATRADAFCEGALLKFLENGSILKWLIRLKEIDDGHMSGLEH